MRKKKGRGRWRPKGIHVGGVNWPREAYKEINAQFERFGERDYTRTHIRQAPRRPRTEWLTRLMFGEEAERLTEELVKDVQDKQLALTKVLVQDLFHYSCRQLAEMSGARLAEREWQAVGWLATPSKDRQPYSSIKHTLGVGDDWFRRLFRRKGIASAIRAYSFARIRMLSPELYEQVMANAKLEGREGAGDRRLWAEIIGDIGGRREVLATNELGPMSTNQIQEWILTREKEVLTIKSARRELETCLTDGGAGTDDDRDSDTE